jgi:hypothetical protein
MTDAEILEWVDGIVLDVANVGSMDDCWKLRELLRRHVYEVRGREVPPLRPALWDTEPGQIT